MYDNDNNRNTGYDGEKIRSNRSFWQRHRLLIIASIAVVVALFFATTTVYLLANRPKAVVAGVVSPTPTVAAATSAATPTSQLTDTPTPAPIGATTVASPVAPTTPLTTTTKNHQFICLTDCDSKFDVLLDSLTINTSSQTMNWDFTVTDNGSICSSMQGGIKLEAPSGDQLQANGGTFTDNTTTINAGQALPLEATFSSIPKQSTQYTVTLTMYCTDSSDNNYHNATYQEELFKY